VVAPGDGAAGSGANSGSVQGLGTYKLRSFSVSPVLALKYFGFWAGSAEFEALHTLMVLHRP
jgi:hypothetical protein